MRKWLLALALIIIAAFLSIYIFIPANLNIVDIKRIQCTTAGAYRNMATVDKWATWWPGKEPQNKQLHYGDDVYQITKTLLNTIEVHIQHQDVSVKSIIRLLPLANDSTIIEWKCNFTSGANPFKRIQRYRQAIDIKNNMAAVLAHFQAFAKKTENIYGISIHESTTKDTLLVATKTVLPAYPSVTDIYTLVDALKKYSSAHHAEPTGSPLLNITPLHPTGFQVMVALPIDKPVPDNGPFFKRQIPRVKFLVTQVKGGSGTVQHALTQFQLYLQDYHRVVMAIPFQQLITNRVAEPDTSKWITTIYVPVF